MARYDESDLMFSIDGDLVISDTGDLSLVNKNEYIEQSARHRVRTSDPDWFDPNMQDIGANLEDLIGMPNNPETARLAIERVTDSLTGGGLIDKQDIYIRPVPVSRYIIALFLFIQTPFEGKPIGFHITFNLETGVTVRGA